MVRISTWARYEAHGRDVALDGESGAAQKKGRRIADGLETGLGGNR